MIFSGWARFARAFGRLRRARFRKFSRRARFAFGGRYCVFIFSGCARFADAVGRLRRARVRVRARRAGRAHAFCSLGFARDRELARRAGLAHAFGSLGLIRIRILASAASFALDSDHANLVLVLAVCARRAGDVSVRERFALGARLAHDGRVRRSVQVLILAGAAWGAPADRVSGVVRGATGGDDGAAVSCGACEAADGKVLEGHVAGLARQGVSCWCGGRGRRRADGRSAARIVEKVVGAAGGAGGRIAARVAVGFARQRLARCGGGVECGPGIARSADLGAVGGAGGAGGGGAVGGAGAAGAGGRGCGDGATASACESIRQN